MQVNHLIRQQLNSVSSFITLLELSDDTDQTRSTPQNHQVIITKGNNSKPIVPSHLIGVSLNCVAGKGDVEAVKILLASGADVNAKDMSRVTALYRAAEYGHKDVVALLLDRMDHNLIAAKDEYGWTALHCAARDGHKDVVALLEKEEESRRRIGGNAT
jgi:ankyrin repeat protein